MDLNKLTLGDRVVAISGVLLLIFAFFPWYGLGGYDENGFEYFLFGTIPVILGLAMIAQIGLARLTTTKLPDVGSLTWGQIHLILGGIAAVLVVLKLLIGQEYFGIDLDRKIGVFLATIAALGLVAGGALKMRDPADAGAGGAPPPPRP